MPFSLLPQSTLKVTIPLSFDAACAKLQAAISNDKNVKPPRERIRYENIYVGKMEGYRFDIGRWKADRANGFRSIAHLTKGTIKPSENGSILTMKIGLSIYLYAILGWWCLFGSALCVSETIVALYFGRELSWFNLLINVIFIGFIYGMLRIAERVRKRNVEIFIAHVFGKETVETRFIASNG
jgi:hypothetical protein